MSLNAAVQYFVMNQTSFDTSQFVFLNARFTSVAFVLSTVTGYLSFLFVLTRFMKNASPFKLAGQFYIHNALLCIASLIMLVLIAPIAYQDWAKNGLFHAICDRSMGLNNHLNWLYYLNYLTKFWELGDTIFMALKKKPLPFLHVYHHSATFILTWAQLAGKTAVQWVPITFNLLVHVIMYYYYAEASRGKRFWWKKHLTTLQIIQFIVDLGFIGTAMYYALIVTPSQCQVEPWAGYMGSALIFSYLLLFVRFFVNTYYVKPAGKKSD
jgi:fatty acid elongase 3